MYSVSQGCSKVCGAIVAWEGMVDMCTVCATRCPRLQGERGGPGEEAVLPQQRTETTHADTRSAKCQRSAAVYICT